VATPVLGWWLLAERFCSQLAMPRIDPHATDRQIERLLTESSLLSSGEGAARRIQTAWSDSMIRSWTRKAAGDWASSDRAARLRATGFMLAVSALTTLAIQALGPRHFEPLGWMFPTAVAIGGSVLSWVANRMAAVGSGKS
jgi:hypothetical protein